MEDLTYDVVVVGGGTGGITVAARLINARKNLKVVIIEPAEKHWYQPAFTLVAGGVYKLSDCMKPMADVIPKGVEWLKDKIVKLDPDNNAVITEKSGTLSYKYLIVSSGISLDFNKIEGLEGNLGKNGICTIYQPDQCEYVWELLQNFKSGRAIFTQPTPPFKCGGAPQKILYLFDDYARKNGFRKNVEILYRSSAMACFGVPFFAKTLKKIITERGIDEAYNYRLRKVDAKAKEATFDLFKDGGKVGEETLKYDILHVVPPMSAHRFIQDSPLVETEGDSKGYLKVDIHTLQNQTYKNVFALGDAAATPNAKTGASVRKQAPILVHNLLNDMEGTNKDLLKYDGYASCPLITGYGKVVLAEFGYTNPDGSSHLLPSFPIIDMSKERYSMWLLKTKVLPILYWKFMLRGKA